MTAELKELYSLDVDCALEAFVPEHSDYFELTVRAMFGPVGDDGSESFQIHVCTPKWLQARCDVGEIVSGRHTLIVGQYDFFAIRDYLVSLCGMCSGSNWSEIAEKLSRYGLWEFEDYRPAS